MKPRKFRLVIAITLGVAAMLAAYLVFDIRRYAGKLGFAVMLAALVLFARPWHTDDGNDDDD